MRPLNQRAGLHQYWSMASWMNHKHQKPWNWEVKLLSSSWPVCAHIKSSQSLRQEVSPAWQVHHSIVDQILSSCCCSSSSLGSAFPSSEPPHLPSKPALCCWSSSEQSSVCWKEKPGCYWWLRQGKKGSFPAACERRTCLLVPVCETPQGIFLIDLTACASMALVPNHPGDLPAPSQPLSRFQWGITSRASTGCEGWKWLCASNQFHNCMFFWEITGFFNKK